MDTRDPGELSAPDPGELSASSWPGPPVGRDPEPDRVVVAGRTSAADREMPDWVVAQVDQVAYPTRMARRRALEAARVTHDWHPDPQVTSPVLARIESDLAELPAAPSPRAAGVGLPGPGPSRLASTAPAPTGSTVAEGQAPASTAVTPAGPSRRVPVRWIAIGLVLALVAAAAGWAVLRSAGQAPESNRPASTSAAPQRLLAVVLSAERQVTGVSLLAAGPGGAQHILVPSRLLLDVPGAGRMPLSQALAVGAQAPTAAVADALGVRVAGSWQLDSDALAALVDAVGGVDVDVDVDVPASRSKGAAILVPAGDGQKLEGELAARYAELLLDEEPETSRSARQERVLTAVLAALPVDAGARRTLLARLPDAPRGPALDLVVALTGQLRDVAESGALPATGVPVREIDAGGAEVAYGLQTDAVRKLTQDRLAGAAIAEPAGGRLRVLVRNGVGAPGLGEQARTRLVAAGLQYVGGGNVAGFGVRTTVVLIPDAGSQQRIRALRVATALGLDARALRTTEQLPSVADVVVVLGRDFAS
ncbi:MAG: LCP family protein [Angustibacter sp.]